MSTNCFTRDTYAVYVNAGHGPGPKLMGADTLIGNDFYIKDGEDLGDKLFAVPWRALTLDTVTSALP